MADVWTARGVTAQADVAFRDAVRKRYKEEKIRYDKE